MQEFFDMFIEGLEQHVVKDKWKKFTIEFSAKRIKGEIHLARSTMTFKTKEE